MRILVRLVIVAAVAISGCLGGEDTSVVKTDDALGDGGAPVTTNETTNDTSLVPVPAILHGGGCAVDAAVFAVPASAVAPTLPPGFVPVEVENDPPQDVTQVILAATFCVNETWDGQEYRDTLGVWRVAIVLPPEDLRDEANITLYFYGVASAPDEGRAAIFRGFGLGEGATISASATTTPASRVGQSAGTIDGLSFDATTVTVTNTSPILDAGLDGAPQGEATYRFFGPAVDGVVTGWTDVSFSASVEWLGASTARLSGGQCGFAYAALDGLAIYRHDMDWMRWRHVPLPVVET